MPGPSEPSLHEGMVMEDLLRGDMEPDKQADKQTGGERAAAPASAADKWVADGRWKAQVPYEVLEKFGPDELQRRQNQVQLFKQRHSATTNAERGILNLVDDDDAPRELYLHQVVAANHLLGKDAGTDWDDRNASLLAVHVVGAGKTVTAVLAVAGVHERTPYPNHNVTFVIVPKAVLEVWYEHFQAWTTLGERVLKVAKQKEVKQEDVEAAAVILTTPDVLLAAYKTFHYKSKKPEDKADPYKRKPQNVRAHPLFDMLDKGSGLIGLTIVDELHRVAKRTNIGAKVVRMFTEKAVYKLGLTGTPVSKSPAQVADLAWALNALTADKKEWMQNPGSFQSFDGNALSINEDTQAKFNLDLVDRVDKHFLKLPEKTVVSLYYDPFIGLKADGTMHAPARKQHNELLKAAKKSIADEEMKRSAASGGGAPSASASAPPPPDDDDDDDDDAPVDGPEAAEDEEIPEAPTGKKWGKGQALVFAAMVALGNYEFSSVLGTNGARRRPPRRGGALRPSGERPEPGDAPHRARHQSTAGANGGHPRVAVFCQSTTQLKILHGYLYGEGRGRAVPVRRQPASPSSATTWSRTFLACHKGVLLFSGAGGIGITLCPGCEVLLSVGSLPWNADGLDQAFGRVHRIGQDKPVEIIQVRGAALRHGRQAEPARRQARPAPGGRGGPGLLAICRRGPHVAVVEEDA